MDFFTTDTKGVWILAPEHELMYERVDNHLFIFNVLNNSDYTKELIKVTLASSGVIHEVESRLADLAKLDRFTFLSVFNRSSTIRGNCSDGKTEFDNYIRLNRIMLNYYTKSGHAGIIPERSFIVDDANTKAVLARLPVINDDVMNALRLAGVIRNWTYVEYPWVNNFKFKHPAGTRPPEDFNKGIQ